MHTLGQTANSGGEKLHIDTTGVDHELDWLTLQPPGDSWSMNLTAIAKQAIAVATRLEQASEQDMAAYRAEARRRLDSIGLFFTAVPELKPAAPKRIGAPPPAPLEWPPGVAGEIARYVYGAAMRPVMEVAIIAALGLLAGICGRQWQTPKSGLNLYIVLIARSAIGKEAMHSGLSEILSACEKDFPTGGKFVDFTEYASGPALIKGCAANPCFVNVSGEVGRRIKRLTADGGRWTRRPTADVANATDKSLPEVVRALVYGWAEL